VTVLAEPQDAIAGGDTGAGQSVGEAVDAVVELGPCEPGVAAHDRRALRVAAPVLTREIPQGKGVECVRGHGAIIPRVSVLRHGAAIATA
jgi:hypothetical protein